MRRNREKGQALYLTAASLVVLIGFLGLGIDMGMLRYERRIQQTAADAAAIAGANNLAWEGSGTPVNCAAANAAANPDSAGSVRGFSDNTGTWSTCGTSFAASSSCPGGIGCVTLTVNNPPLSGPHVCGTDTNCNSYVEAIVSVVQPTYFMRIFDVLGGSHDSATVAARAVATDYTGASPTSNCLYTLGTPAKKIGVDPYGHATINATTCGIVDNGNFNPTGNALTINSCSFNVSGANTGNNGGNVYCNGTSTSPSYGMPTQPDPLAKLAPPSPTSPATAWTGTPPTSCTTFPCAIYNGITVGTGGFPSTVNFAPGVYVVTGNDFSCAAGSTITGNGVMFYFTNGATINCQGSVNMSLGAACGTSGCACPTGISGSCYCPDSICPSQYDGILMYQDPNDTNTGLGGNNICPPPGSGNNTGPQLGGNDGSVYGGVLYFPGDQLYLTGNTSTTVNCTAGSTCITVSASVTDTLCTGGNATFNVTGITGSSNPFPTLSNAILVE